MMSSNEPIDLDLSNLTPKQSILLATYLREHPESACIQPSVPLIMKQPHKKTKKTIAIQLNREIFHRVSQSDNDKHDHHIKGERYEVISNECLGKGNQGAVYRLAPFTLILPLAKDQGMIIKDKSQKPPRIVKKSIKKITALEDQQNFSNVANKECNFITIGCPDLHVKPVSLHLYKDKEDNLVMESDMVMRCFKGSSLTEVLHQNPNAISLTQRIQLTLALLTELNQLHLKGILHRDIKPDNILINLSDNPIKVAIIDYGLSCKKDEKLSDTPGTIGYAPPELFLPILRIDSNSPLTEQSDIFSLGIVLCQLWGGDITSSDEIRRHPGMVFYSSPKKLFNEITGLDCFNQETIQQALTGMCMRNPRNRKALSEIIQVFKNMLTTLSTHTNDHINPVEEAESKLCPLTLFNTNRCDSRKISNEIKAEIKAPSLSQQNRF